MRNKDFPLIDRAISRFDDWVFHLIMRNGGYPPRNRFRFVLGWWINDHICCPLYRWRKKARAA